jgi:hypothetical protein
MTEAHQCGVCDEFGHRGRFCPRAKPEARPQRLASGRADTLFHQTDPESARSIISSQAFRCGSSNCLAGSGIYFTTTPEHTDHKARHKGVILQAHVKLGRFKRLSAQGDPSTTFQSLLKEGYDSVSIDRGKGHEYVVYNPDQISNIAVYNGEPRDIMTGPYMDQLFGPPGNMQDYFRDQKRWIKDCELRGIKF